MSMADGTEQAAPAAAEAPAPGPEAQAEPTPAGGGNPAWDELRSEVGDTAFHVIKPHLQKWDTSAQERITRVNQDLKKYTDLGDFENLQTGYALTQQLESDPVAFANNLIGILKENGQWEEAAALEEAVDDEGEEEPEDPRDAQIKALTEALDKVQSRFTQEDSARLEAQWASEWDQSFAAAKSQNPWLSDEDDSLLRTIAQNHIEDDTEIPDAFAKAFADLNNYRTRTLSAPRANDAAPRLIQAAGGNPAAAQQQDVSKLGRGATVDLVANILKAQQQQD